MARLDKFNIISVQEGPLEGGGEYRSIWLHPFEWEDRGAPHKTKGPVPFKLGCEKEVFNKIFDGPTLPCVYALEVGVKVASGNKSQGHAYAAELIQAETQVEEPKVEDPKVEEPKVDESKADEPKNEFMRKRA